MAAKSQRNASRRNCCKRRRQTSDGTGHCRWTWRCCAKDPKWYCSFTGSWPQGRPARRLLVGGLLGIAAGAAFSALTYFGLLAIPNRYIFSVTSWLIALLAAGMAAQSVQFLNNAGLVVALDHTVWDTSWLLSEGSIFGRMLHALIGYTERPTEMQLVVYVCILIAMFVLMRVARYSPRHSVPAAAE